MNTQKTIIGYKEGSFHDLDSPPEITRRPMSVRGRPAYHKRLRQLGDQVVKKCTYLKDAAVEKIEKIYDPNEPLRAEILEWDTSIRTLPVMRPATNWIGRPWADYSARIHYKRQYDFPVALLCSKSSPYPFLAGYSTLTEAEKPVARFGMWVQSHMKDQITEMTMYTTSLSVHLTEAADRQWQQERPELFYRQLGNLVSARHPEYPLCVVVRKE